MDRPLMTAGDTAKPLFFVRGVRNKDIAALQILCHHLGYDDDTNLGERLNAVTSDPNHAVFVAAGDDDQPIGFIHVFGRLMIEATASAQVQALCISPELRRSGVGKLLIGAAEQWALARGFHQMVLYCETSRVEAHQFYDDVGYEKAPPSSRFIKKLG